MTKRRLTRQQEQRIRQRQRQQVDERQRVDDEGNQTAHSAGRAGLVTCNFGQQLEVEALQGPQAGQLFRCYQRSNLPPLVCGDRVVFETDQDDGGVIVGLEERNNVFCRPGASGQLKPVAANVDLVLVVLAPRPEPFLNLLDRYLVAVENLSLKPLVVINKSDLRDRNPAPVIDTILQDYPALGYDVLAVSAHTELGLEQLKAALAGKTTVVVGQSGVGKSSLVNALSTGISARIGGLSGSAGKGTHTTTAAQLFHLDGFNLIDSPGIREFGLWHISSDQLLNGFVEFRPFLGHCKFRDCSHGHEPGCALRAAVESGAVHAYRLESYFQILATLQAG